MSSLPPNTRNTRTRRAMMDIFASTDHPLSAGQVHKLLKRINVKANITTIYREIEFLLKHRTIQKIDISGDTTFYESTDRNHHHHAVCTSCGNIQDIAIEDEDEIMRHFNIPQTFKVHRHSLEFYGHCGSCN